MSRDDGFEVADLATGLFDDPKVNALWRRLGDQGRMAHALTLYMATVLASWRHGCRVTVEAAVPLWLTADAELVVALQSARLLDKAGRLPKHSWEGWFGPAFERREARREAGRLGGRLSRKPPVSGATASVKRRLSVAVPDRPSVPTVRPPRAPARERRPNGQKETTTTGSFHELMAANGLAPGLQPVAALLGSPMTAEASASLSPLEADDG